MVEPSQDVTRATFVPDNSTPGIFGIECFWVVPEASPSDRAALAVINRNIPVCRQRMSDIRAAVTPQMHEGVGLEGLVGNLAQIGVVIRSVRDFVERIGEEQRRTAIECTLEELQACLETVLGFTARRDSDEVDTAASASASVSGLDGNNTLSPEEGSSPKEISPEVRAQNVLRAVELTLEVIADSSAAARFLPSTDAPGDEKEAEEGELSVDGPRQEPSPVSVFVDMVSSGQYPKIMEIGSLLKADPRLQGELIAEIGTIEDSSARAAALKFVTNITGTSLQIFSGMDRLLASLRQGATQAERASEAMLSALMQRTSALQERQAELSQLIVVLGRIDSKLETLDQLTDVY